MFQIEPAEEISAACNTLLASSSVELLAVGASVDAGCDVASASVDIIDGGCYTGDLASGYDFSLKMFKVGDRVNLLTSADFSCKIETTITIEELVLDVTAPTFEGAEHTDDTDYDLTLSTIVDGDAVKLPAFGSEVAVYATFTPASHFTATLTGCQVNGEDPTAYKFAVDAVDVQAATANAVSAVTDKVPAVMYFTAIETMTINGCTVTLA